MDYKWIQMDSCNFCIQRKVFKPSKGTFFLAPSWHLWSTAGIPSTFPRRVCRSPRPGMKITVDGSLARSSTI